MPINDIRVLRRWVNFGILRIEALPNRGDHLREPAYSQSLFSCLARKRKDTTKAIGLTRTCSAR